MSFCLFYIFFFFINILIIYDKNIIIITTNAQSSIVVTRPFEYLWIIEIKLSGIYYPLIALTSFNPMLFLMNVRILKKISTIATKNTKDENLLKNIITSSINTIKTIKSIYIETPLFFLFILT